MAADQEDPALRSIAQLSFQELKADTSDPDVQPTETLATVLGNQNTLYKIKWVSRVTIAMLPSLRQGKRYAHHAHAAGQAVKRGMSPLTAGAKCPDWGIRAEEAMAEARQSYARGNAQHALKVWAGVLCAIMQECQDGGIIRSLLAERSTQRMHRSQARNALRGALVHPAC